MTHVIIRHRDCLGVEGVCFNNICAGLKIFFMNSANDFWPGDAEQLVISFHINVPVAKLFTPVIGFLKFVALDHCAHCAINHEDPVFQQILDGLHVNFFKPML